MSPVMKWSFVAAAVAAALVVVDRLLLAAERRGWIYWRKRKASPGSLAGAMLEIHSLMQPSARHVAEEQRRVIHEEDDSGEPPDSATGTMRETISPPGGPSSLLRSSMLSNLRSDSPGPARADHRS